MSSVEQPDAQSPLTAGLKPVSLSRVTTARAIYERLHAGILSLQLPPGMVLQEKKIADQFGVSRTPVREALLRLSEGGLVEIYPQSGTVVSRVPVSAIPEAVVVRKALETVTVEQAARQAGQPALERLDQIIKRQQTFAALNDASGFHEQDEAFHEAIAQIAGFPGIWALLKTVKVQIDRARRLTLPVLGRMETVIQEHVTIRDALAAHDANGAREAMLHHLEAVILDVEELRQSYPDYFC
ncbi:GntR family transcriptional regulator [Allorhizobium sonneratiae]|uniref:GntR family transcriptional regulator n=1 Tax=Allorhizobium sonneratiae TaxID=2934936 RepID=UPI0020341112|nr:GntR family transcriptional regulator [Allorhizobium sonneratiae]